MSNNSKNKIIKVAIKEFADKGYEATSIRDICKKAGVNISSIAYYFNGKKGLYDEILSYVVDEINKYVSTFVEEYKILEKSFPAPKKSKQMLINIIHRFIEVICLPKIPKDIAYIYLYEYIKPSSSFYIVENGLNSVYMPIVKNLMIDASNGKLSNEDASLYTFMLFSQIFNVVVRKEPILKLMNWQDYSEKEINKICEIVDKSLIV